MNNVVSLIKRHWVSVTWYVLGFFVLGLGVNVMKASTLGNGAWDTVTINGRAFFQENIGWDWVTLGMMSMVVSLSLFVLVTLYRKRLRYVFMLIPIFLVASFIDFWNIVVFQDRLLEQLGWQIGFYMSGIFILPFGLTMVVKSGYPAFVFDEVMLMFVKIFKAKKITYVRLGIEFTGIAIGALLGYIAVYPIEGTLGAVNWGSLLFTFALSPIMTMYYHLLGVSHE